MTLTTLSLLCCLLTMTNSFLLSRGWLRAVYLLGIFNGSCYVVLNLLLALRDGQGGVTWLIVPSAWGVLMCGLGWRRLRRK